MITTARDASFRPFRQNRLLQGTLVVYALVWILTAWKPLYPHDWMMENLLVFVTVPALALTYRRFPLSDLSYLLIALFLALHAIGAHYTYSNVPFGFYLKEVLHLSRNPFDRLVHFSFGLLLAYPVREIFLRIAKTRGFWNYYLPLDVVLAFSAVFELFEMAAALLTSPELGDAYLGTQGDVFDAQKDMLMAGLGAAIAMAVTWLLRRQLFPGDPET